MKLLNKISLLAIVTFTTGMGLSACETKRTTETTTTATTDAAGETRTETDTIRVTRRSKSAAQELNDFKDWVNSKAGKADSATKENWPEVKAEFKEKTARLEKGLDSLSTDAKAEYQKAKVRYQEWERQNQQRATQPLQAAEIQKRQAQLLGEYKDLNTITAANIREAYLIFMGMVRAKKQNWNQNDWDYVDYIYRQLNNRKDELSTSISGADKLKIKSLQAEYLALEAGQDAKDLLNTVKK